MRSSRTMTAYAATRCRRGRAMPAIVSGAPAGRGGRLAPVARPATSPAAAPGLVTRSTARPPRPAVRPYGSRDDPAAPTRRGAEGPGQAARPVARQRQDGAGHHRGGGAHDRAGAPRRREVADLRLHLLLPHPGVRADHRLPVEVVPLQQAPPVGPAHHDGGAVRRVLLADDPLALRPRRARAAGVVPEPALADVVPRGHGDVAAAHPAAADTPGDGAGVGRGEPARGPGQQRAVRHQPDARVPAVLRDRPAPQARAPCPRAASWRVGRRRGRDAVPVVAGRAHRPLLGDAVPVLPGAVRRARRRRPRGHLDPGPADRRGPGRAPHPC